MQPVALGVVGIGRWGRNYVKTLLDVPSCRVRALADSDPAALNPEPGARKPLDGVRRYPGIEPMLEDASVRAVVIATPDHTHFDLARRSLESGRDVLVEKPLCRTLAEARRLTALAAERGRVLAVGHTTLYQPQFAGLRAALAQARLGRPLRVESVRTSAGPRDRTGADVLWDLGPHDLAMVVSLLGLPASCRVGSSGPDQTEFELLFPDEVRASCRLAWTSGSRIRRFSLTGTLGTRTITEDAGPSPGDRPLFRQSCDFIACCRERSRPQSDARLGLDVVRCLESLDRSGREGGRWVGLNESHAPCEAWVETQ